MQKTYHKRSILGVLKRNHMFEQYKEHSQCDERPHKSFKLACVLFSAAMLEQHDAISSTQCKTLPEKYL
jgi:hypothetical protein